MCLISFVGDRYTDRIPKEFPWIQPLPVPQAVPGGGGGYTVFNSPSRAEFDALKKMVEEMHGWLIAARQADEAAGEPDCEMEDKVRLLKEIAELVGVDLSDVFG